jgi:catalase
MANPSGGFAQDKRLCYEQLVDTLNVVFGLHPGCRAVHAKGMVCEGAFEPNPNAAALSRAPHFAAPVPITVRFSNFSGIPTVPDGDPSASPRGMAVRFHLPDGAATDIVAHSYDGFPVRTAETFLAFLHALAATRPETRKPTPLDAFLSDHPEAKRFVAAPKPTPRSFATERYYGVDAFRFTNLQGNSRFGRYRIIPLAGTHYLDTGETARRPADFLLDELSGRLRENPVEFRLAVQLAAGEDAVDDPCTTWPDRRPQVELGILRIARTAGNRAASLAGFDPARLTDGIEPSDDPLILARSAIYAIAARRRNGK